MINRLLFPTYVKSLASARSLTMASLLVLAAAMLVVAPAPAYAGNECLVDVTNDGVATAGGDSDLGAITVGATDSIACGPDASVIAGASDAVVIGHDSSVASATSAAVAIGNDADIGEFAAANNGRQSVAIGADADVGFGALANDAVAIGAGADVGATHTAVGGTAVGAFTDVSEFKGTAIGSGARVNDGATAGVAMGDSAAASGEKAIAIGEDAQGGDAADDRGAIAIGNDGDDDATGANATAAGAIAIGEDAGANGTRAVAVGRSAFAPGTNTVALGAFAGQLSSGNGHVFLGHSAGKNELGQQKLYIENSDSSSPLIYGEFDNDVVVINGDFSAGSSREIKRAFAPVAPRKVLEHLLDLPIAKWSFRAGNPETRHIGPTSEDFHAAFEVGRDDKHISPLDLSGVALAAIQGLKAEKDQELAALKEQTNTRIATRDAEIKMLREELAQLRALVNRLVASDASGATN